MTKFVSAKVEACSDDDNADCVVLYFDGAASASLIRDTCRDLLKQKLNPKVPPKKKLPLTVDPDGEYFSYEEVATPASKSANLRRYELSPAE